MNRPPSGNNRNAFKTDDLSNNNNNNNNNNCKLEKLSAVIAAFAEDSRKGHKGHPLSKPAPKRGVLLPSSKVQGRFHQKSSTRAQRLLRRLDRFYGEFCGPNVDVEELDGWGTSVVNAEDEAMIDSSSSSCYDNDMALDGNESYRGPVDFDKMHDSWYDQQNIVSDDEDKDQGDHRLGQEEQESDMSSYSIPWDYLGADFERPPLRSPFQRQPLREPHHKQQQKPQQQCLVDEIKQGERSHSAKSEQATDQSCWCAQTDVATGTGTTTDSTMPSPGATAVKPAMLITVENTAASRPPMCIYIRRATPNSVESLKLQQEALTSI